MNRPTSHGTTPTHDLLLRKFSERTATVGVIGLGYVGLPLAVAFARAGYTVIGIDVDAAKVAQVNAGQSYIKDISADLLQQFVGAAGQQTRAIAGRAPAAVADTQSGALWATTEYAQLAACDAISICVPTPLNKTGDPEVSYIVDASQQVAAHLRQGQVIVLESTTYPGTTQELLLPRLLENQSNLVIGEDFFVAFSPERIDPGRNDWTVETMPKVIGGVTEACLAVASAYYAPAVGPLVPVSSPDAAEMTKLFENTFRSVNIALANELMLICDKLGLDAWEVLDAAASKPFGFMKFVPGPGLGGHCIPVDPHYLSWKLRTLEYRVRFVDLASEINMDMPRYWVQKAQDALNDAGKAVKNSRVLLLGVAYKRDVGDLRESPALDIIDLLANKGALVEYHDPHVSSFTYNDKALACVADLDAALQVADCVIVTTDHSDYDWAAVRGQADLVIDTRHVVPDHV